MSNAKERRERKAAEKARTQQIVWIPIPEEFLDLDNKPWRLVLDGRPEELDLLEVVVQTLRRIPTKTIGEAERGLDLIEYIRSNEENDCIQITKSDFDWMLARFKEDGFKVWLAPDGAYLIRYLERNAANKKPPSVVEEASTIAANVDGIEG